MMPRRELALCLLVVATSGCGADDDRPAAAAAGGAAPAGKPTGVSGRPSQPEAGAPATAEGGAGAEAGAGAGGDDGIGHLDDLGEPNTAGGGPSAPPVCDQDADWGGATALTGVSTTADERLISATLDELTLVFTRDDVLMLAERDSATSDFEQESALVLPSGYTHLHGLALSPDGLRLVVVSESGQALGELTRPNRKQSFGGEVQLERYAALNFDAAQYGAYLASPVLAHAGDSLYYVRLTGDASLTFHARGGATFGVPEMAEDPVTLGSDDGNAKLTLSASADERTLFIFDQALGHVVGLWNRRPAAPFTQMAPFPGLSSVFTNTDCTRLYATSESEGQLDIVLFTPR